MGKAIKSMTYEEARAYQKELKAQGKTASTSKEYGKVENYIKTLKPENYGKDTVASAYKQLSSGVTTTGGWTGANLDKIEEYTGTRPQLTSPSSSAELPSYLGKYQDSIYSSAGTPELRQSIVEQLKPSTDKPAPLDRVKEFESMREQYGVAELETNLTNLKAELEAINAQKRERISNAESKPVAMGVIAGRVGEIERQETFRIDAINRQINTIVDQLNTSYNIIQTYMNFKGLDYQDAVNAYNTEFNQNLQIYQLVQADLDRQTAAARSNLQIYMNAITSGNLNYKNLSSEQKATINKMELQSGLPIGFMSKLTMSTKDKILSVNSDTGEVLMMDGNGGFKVVKTGMTVKPTSGAGSSGFASALAQGRDDLESGYSWGSVYNRIKSAYPDATPEQIDAGLGIEWREGGAYEAFKAKTGNKTTDTSISTDLRDAQAAIQAGADESAVRRRFIEKHPSSANLFDSYME